MNLRNPHPNDALVRRKRLSYRKEEQLTEAQQQEIQDQKQAAHGAAVAKQLAAKAAKAKRDKLILSRGQPQVRDEMAEAVQSRMANASDIPTRGNTDA
jgi:hypothetical protein